MDGCLQKLNNLSVLSGKNSDPPPQQLLRQNLGTFSIIALEIIISDYLWQQAYSREQKCRMRPLDFSIWLTFGASIY